jgi:VWFA-related protein
MKRYLIVVLLLAAGPGLAQEKPEATPSFPSRVELVTVDAVVTDKKGLPITGLSQADFVVSEDGKPQEISSFEAVELPVAPAMAPPQKPSISINTAPEARTGRSFIIIFDDVHLTPGQARRAKAAVAEFLKSGVREGDRVTLIATGGEAWWSARMTTGRDELIGLLKRLEGRHIPDTGTDRMSDFEAMRIHVYSDPQVMDRVRRRFETYGVSPTGRGGQSMNADPAGDPMARGKAAEVYFQSVNRSRLTLELVTRVLDSLATARGRKSLVLVSEGFIYDPNLDEFRQVVQSSRRANCAIYFVDTRGLSGMPDFFSAQFGPAMDTQDLGAVWGDQFQAAEGTESIAADSGGFSVSNSNDLAKGFQRIADETRVYYLLGYHPTNAAQDGRFRKIKLEVKRKGAQVRARKGYYAPLLGGAKPAKTAAKGGPEPEFQQAVDSPYERDDVPLRMTAYVLDETLLGKAKVLLDAEVDVRSFAFQEKEGRLTDTLEFLMVAVHRETGEYFRYDQKIDMKLQPDTREKLLRTWLPIVREFELAPGAYQAKIVVKDKNGARIGTLMHEFEVPDLARFRVSTPVVSDLLQAGSEGAAPRPAPLARRSFTPASTLFCQYEVFGAEKEPATGMPRVTAGYQIRRADGGVLTEMEPSLIKPTSLGKLMRLVGTPLERATPGAYELVLSLKDEVSGKTLELREPFTVEPVGSGTTPPA